jgi:pyridoxal phosphate enzyme (YggS family)
MVASTGSAADPAIIAANLALIRERIAVAAARAGRSPASVRLVGVSKTFPAAAVTSAVQAGLMDVGENRVQEAATKAPEVTAAGGRPLWHLVGHLQTNKVKAALSIFGYIHSVDSLRLAESLSRHAEAPLDLLLEVNVAGEATKTGFAPSNLPAAVAAIAALPSLRLNGLMTVAPEAPNPEDARPVFRTLRTLNESLGLTELSMGMSGDFEVAIEEGATMVRIGRAIFGPR